MLAGKAIDVSIDANQHPASPATSDPLRRTVDDIRAKLPAINACQGPADLRAWLLKFARNLGFYGARYVHIGTRWWGIEDAVMPLRFQSTSDQDRDEREDWLTRDPNVARIRKAFAPFAWSTRIAADLTEPQCAWLERERARGVAAGVAVPIHDSLDGPAYLSLFGYDEVAVATLVSEHAPELAFVAAQYHALAKTLLPVEDWAPQLSEHEIVCLRLAALGRTVRESGKVLGVSPRTVEYHLQKAAEKLGAETKTRAVVLAFGNGLAQV